MDRRHREDSTGFAAVRQYPTCGQSVHTIVVVVVMRNGESGSGMWLSVGMCLAKDCTPVL